MKQEFMLQEGESRKAYFTRAAKAVKSIRQGSDYQGRNLKKELTKEEQAEVTNYVFLQLMPEIKRASAMQSQNMHFNRHAREEFDSILQLMTFEEFPKFNDPAFMRAGSGMCDIEAFIGNIRPRAMRVYLCESRGLPVNMVRNMRYIDLAIDAIIQEEALDYEDVKPEMIHQRLNDKSISLKMIVRLMNVMKGNLSLELMTEESEWSQGYEEAEDKLDIEANISEHVKQILAEVFSKLSKTDMCLLMKKTGLLGEDLQKMQIKDFVETDLFKRIFEADETVRAKNNPVKAAYNRRDKVDRVLASLGAKLQMDEVKGHLAAYALIFSWYSTVTRTPSTLCLGFSTGGLPILCAITQPPPFHLLILYPKFTFRSTNSWYNLCHNRKEFSFISFPWLQSPFGWNSYKFLSDMVAQRSRQ